MAASGQDHPSRDTYLRLDPPAGPRDDPAELRDASTDYVLAVKHNQPTLHREMKAAFDDAERGSFRPETEAATP